MHTNINRIVFLDYLRVFAFASVLIGHKFYDDLLSSMESFSTRHITQKYFSDLFLSMFTGGGAGVVVFFMISGYIILHVLQSEKPTEFLIKRVFRIYPLLIVAILIEALLYNIVLDVPFNLKNIFLQMTLLGDFFNIPYSLAGVEWTLRIEIMFYLFMAILRFFNIFKYSGYIFMIIAFLCVLLLNYFAPFPSGLFIGYFTIYAPFLFLGSIFYLYELNKINFLSFVLYIIFMFSNYFSMIGQFWPNWLLSNFAIVGFSIFSTFWLFRDRLINSSIILVLSGMTYSVYLFHNFLWLFISIGLQYFEIENKALVLAVLLIFCFFTYKLIEKPFITIGKKVLMYKIKSKQTEIA